MRLQYELIGDASESKMNTPSLPTRRLLLVRLPTSFSVGGGEEGLLTNEASSSEDRFLHRLDSGGERKVGVVPDKQFIDY